MSLADEALLGDIPALKSRVLGINITEAVGYTPHEVGSDQLSGGRREMETRDPKALSWEKLNQWIGWAVICLSGGLMAATMFLPHG
jgi:hypothetical protein